MSSAADVPEITPTELRSRLDRGDVPLLLDVREPHERGIIDLPEHGQLLIPMGQILARLGEIDAGRDVVVYCRSGVRSASVVKLLQESGIAHAVNLKGGVLAWRQDVDPTLQAY
jgi:adenylyltransferase/sulfurtransferase